MTFRDKDSLRRLSLFLFQAFFLDALQESGRGFI